MIRRIHYIDQPGVNYWRHDCVHGHTEALLPFKVECCNVDYRRDGDYVEVDDHKEPTVIPAIADVIAQLRELEKKATAGPWTFRATNKDCYTVNSAEGLDGAPVFGCYGNYEESAPCDQDASLIVAMRNHLPSLLSYIAKLEKVAEDAEGYFRMHNGGAEYEARIYAEAAKQALAALDGDP